MANNSRPYIYFPILFSLVFILGIFLGTKLDFTVPVESGFPMPQKRFSKLNEIINYIEQEYVDSVSKEELVEKTIHDLLQELDPHSYYISAADIKAMNEPLEGNFEGIGIEFSIQKDTIVVINPIAGGPSEMLGIQAGDRIIKVDGKDVASTKITNNDVMGLLRGKRGTKVKVTIFRHSTSREIDFTITRDAIPIYSIDVANMLNHETGYIKISRFSKTTNEEFVSAEQKLLENGMKKLILDLRGNGGGYLDAAVKLADEFLAKDQLIVYTEGRSRPKEMYHATSRGKLTDTELVVLIDEGSASASEIIAGAVQDNDRGTIIGRRSFGKGLVQEQSTWPDGSALRLTIARYYTPTGRSIQKPYTGGTKKYYEDYYESLGLEDSLPKSDSSIIVDSIKYNTPKGKVLYGGGGIMPDIVIQHDTSDRSLFLAQISYAGLFNQFSFEYADKKRDYLKSFKSLDSFRKTFEVDEDLLAEFISFTGKNGSVKTVNTLSEKEQRQIKQRLKANIARYMWNYEGFYVIMQDDDKFLQKAVEVLSEKN